MIPQRLDIVAANLCGCIIEHIHQHEQQITVDLIDPRLGAMVLICEEAALLSSSTEYIAFMQHAPPIRKVDWVDIIDGHTLYIYLKHGSQLALHTQHAAIERRN